MPERSLGSVIVDPNDAPFQAVCRIEAPRFLLGIVEELQESARGQGFITKQFPRGGEIDLGDERKRLAVGRRPRFARWKTRLSAKVSDSMTTSVRSEKERPLFGGEDSVDPFTSWFSFSKVGRSGRANP